jgi:toxin ParE1/3/4
MSRYVVTRQARADIKDICRYIARDSQRAAGKIRELLYDKFVLLAQHPPIGQSRPELADELRSFSAGRYVIFFRPIAGGVAIVRVLHGARDIEAIFGGEG